MLGVCVRSLCWLDASYHGPLLLRGDGKLLPGEAVFLPSVLVAPGDGFVHLGPVCNPRGVSGFGQPGNPGCPGRTVCRFDAEQAPRAVDGRSAVPTRVAGRDHLDDPLFFRVEAVRSIDEKLPIPLVFRALYGGVAFPVPCSGISVSNSFSIGNYRSPVNHVIVSGEPARRGRLYDRKPAVRIDRAQDMCNSVFYSAVSG